MPTVIFNAYPQLDDLFDAYTQALCQEIQTVGQGRPLFPIHTIFFGGGTPSLLPATAYQAIFGVLRRYFDLSQTCEITLEANPGTVDLPIFRSHCSSPPESIVYPLGCNPPNLPNCGSFKSITRF